MDAAALIELLAHTAESDLERIYASADCAMTRGDVYLAAKAKLPVAAWLATRLGAGPPGVPLPAPAEAAMRMMAGQGNAADAYAVLFGETRFPAEDVATALIQNAALQAFGAGGGLLAARLAVAAAVACMVAGDEPRARFWLDLDEQHQIPTFDSVRLLRPALSLPGLLDDPWFRRAAWSRWVDVAVPAVPVLPLAENGPCEVRLRAALLDRLEPFAKARDWVSVGLLLWDVHVADEVEGEPYVGQLRESALRGAEDPPDGDVPQDLATWAILSHRRGHHAVARLAGLAAIRAGVASDGAWIAVSADVRARDVPTLLAVLPSEIAEILQEVEGVRHQLPEELGQLLIRTVFPHHPGVDAAQSVLLAEREQLRSIATADRPWLRHLVVWLDEVAAKPADGLAPGFFQAVQGAVDRLAPFERVTVPALMAAVDGLGEPSWNVGDAAMVFAAFSDAASRLVGALVLRGREVSLDKAVALASVAAEAIRRLSARPLFSLRAELLDEVVKYGPSPRARAQAMVSLGNTRNALAEGDLSVREGVLVLLREAEELAYATGALDVYVDAVIVRAKTLSLGLLDLPGGIERREEAFGDLKRVAELPIADADRGQILWMMATLWAQPCEHDDGADFHQVVALLELALPILANDDWKRDVERELSHAYGLVGRVADAIAMATRALDAATSEMTREDRGLLHAQLAKSLALGGRPAEAEAHFRQALRYLGQAQEGILAMLHFAWFLLQEDRDGEALDIVGRIRRSEGRLTKTDRRELARIHAALLARSGRHAEALAAENKAVEEAKGTAWEAIVLIDGAMQRGDHDAAFGVVEQYIDGRWPPTNQANNRLADLLSAHVKLIPSRLADHALPWAALVGRVWLHAALLARAGKDAAAVDVLLAGIEATSDPEERVKLRLLLLGLMPHHDVNAVRSQIEELERDAGDPSTLPGTAQVDLAAACEIAAAGEPGWSDRALTYAARAFEAAREHSWLPHAAWTWVRLVYRRAENEGILSSPRLASMVGGALIAVPELPAEHDDLVLALAHRLLIPGPIAHPEILLVASELLDLARPSTDRDQLQRRAESSGRVAKGEAHVRVVPPPRGAAPGPFDAHEVRWLADAIAGRLAGVLPSQLLAEESLLAVATEVRPDRADSLLSALLSAAVTLSVEDGQRWMDHIRLCVERLGPDAARWPLLVGAIEALPVAKARLVDGVRRGLRSDRKSGRRAVPVDYTALFDRAVRAMEEHRVGVKPAKEAALKAAAIRDLDAALRLVVGTPAEVNVLISRGNASRLTPSPDPSDAIRHYERALALKPTDDGHLGKVHKVWADALRERGDGDDLRAAWERVQRALRHRREGYLRAETLWAAAQIADVHPDWNPERRDDMSVDLVVDAVMCAPEVVEPIVPWLFPRMARLAKRKAAAAARASEVLRGAFPSLSDEIARAAGGATTGPFGGPVLSADEMKALPELMKDPGWMVVARAESAVGPPELLIAQVERALRGTPNPTGKGIERVADEMRAAHSTDGLRLMLAKLEQGSATDAAGRAVAKAIVLAELVRRNLGNVENVSLATERALELVRAHVSPAIVRASLLDRLGHLWGPDNHVSDPVLDFSRAVAIRREAVALAGGVDVAPRDILGGLARSLRYCPSGSIAENRAEARRLYERCLDHDRAAGNATGIANMLDLLADLLMDLTDGDEIQRMRRAAAMGREAIALATDDVRKSMYAANHAWTLTKLGLRLPAAERRQLLGDAEHHYDLARRLALGGKVSLQVESNEAVCLEALAELNGDDGFGIRYWTEREAMLRDGGHPVDHALAQHNLSLALIRRGGQQDLRDATDLLRDALRDRTTAVDARHHWETAIALGRLLRRRARCGDPVSRSWRSEAHSAFRSAIRAAAELGHGTELAQASLDLGRLALAASDPHTVARWAEEAWEGLHQAMPHLLLSADLARAQSAWSTDVAFRLADLHVQTGLVGRVADGYALGSDASELVTRWLMRADTTYARAVSARVNVPRGVPGTVRLAWLQALSQGDSETLAPALAAIREVQPGWLTEEPFLAWTIRWLRQAPRSAALAVWPGQEGLVVVLLDGETGRPTVFVLHAVVPAVGEGEVAQQLTDRDQRAQTLEKLVGWAKSEVADRIGRVIGNSRRRLLWVPRGLLRLVPPSMLFPNVSVSVSASLALRPASSGRSRDGVPVVVLADPAEAEARLGDDARRGAERLASLLSGARLVVGVGARHGPAVSAAAEDVHPTVPQVLREFDHASLAVVIAHGRTESATEASVDLLRDDGGVDPLGMDALGRDPGVVDGLPVILLSCSTGQTGSEPDLPGGIAGTMLVAGAREVVAPLWPVSLNAALVVGERLCEAHRNGKPFADVLNARADGAQGGPELGRPTPADRAASKWDGVAFVTWVG